MELEGARDIFLGLWKMFYMYGLGVILVVLIFTAMEVLESWLDRKVQQKRREVQ